MTQRLHDPNTAFHADLSAPSIFRSDSRFLATRRTGKTLSQTTSDVVAAVIARTGRSPGTLKGLSQRADLAAEEWAASQGRDV
jgi:hypothetical protein